MKKSKIKNQKSKILLLFLLLLIAQSLYSQAFNDGYYRLTTQWQGEGKSLDVINDGVNNKLHLVNSANVTGQFWKITSLGNGYYRLTTQWQGENKSLDVVNDGTNNKLQLAATSNVSGQFWKITSVGNGFYRLTTKWLGEGKSLDIVNDGTNNKLKLADTDNVSGQFWKITNTAPGSTISINTDATPVSVQKFRQISLSGFRIMVNPITAENEETKEALAILADRLELITKTLPSKHLEKLKKVAFWMQYKETTGGMAYHPSKEWLISNGYTPEMEKSIEIQNIRHFIDWQGDQPFMVLHELAHAYDDLYLGEMQNQIVQAYENAVSSKKYESVPYIRGGKQRHYALNNKTEYFAELSEAYFGKNDFYPFNREDLKQFDPMGYQLMQDAWK